MPPRLYARQPRCRHRPPCPSAAGARFHFGAERWEVAARFQPKTAIIFLAADHVKVTVADGAF